MAHGRGRAGSWAFGRRVKIFSIAAVILFNVMLFYRVLRGPAGVESGHPRPAGFEGSYTTDSLVRELMDVAVGQTASLSDERKAVEFVKSSCWTSRASPWLVIGIPSVPRKSPGEQYLKRTLMQLKKAMPRPGDLLFGRVHVIVMNNRLGEHEMFEIEKQRYNGDSTMSFLENLTPDPESGGPFDRGNANRPGTTVRRQSRDVVQLLHTAASFDPEFYLFMEDDFDTCPYFFQSLNYLIGKANRYQPQGFSALVVSYGLSGIVLSGKDVKVFADYLSRHAHRRPPDHLIVEWFARETRESKEYFGNRYNMASRYNLLSHFGHVSSIHPHGVGAFPGCYEELLEPVIFPVCAFDPKKCPNDDIWPCSDANDDVDAFPLLRLSAAAFICGPQHTEHQQKERVKWMKGRNFNEYVMELWKSADKNRDGSLSSNEIRHLLCVLNISCSKKEFLRLFKKFDLDKNGTIDFQEFRAMIENLSERPEIDQIFDEMAGGMKRVTAKQFMDFANEKLFMGWTEEECLDELWRLFGGRPAEQMPFPGVGPRMFGQFLDSPENDFSKHTPKDVYESMDQSLSSYFIASSHNTYLVGDQLRGMSSVDQYARVLRAGARCIEIDCWDGPDGPLVFHGHTLTSKILFQDVIQMIADHAFASSPYPVILSLEMHCSVPQQVLIAAVLAAHLSSMLVTHFDGTEALPSPNELKGKILIKCPVQQTDEMVEADEELDNQADVPGEMKKNARTKIAKELSELVAIPTTKFLGSDAALEAPVNLISSFAETALSKHHRSDLLRFSARKLARVYPRGTRFDSSNYDPVAAWLCGFQLVALNYQTIDPHLQRNEGLFEENGGCGYVLKPEYMRKGQDRRNDTSLVLEIAIISGHSLPKDQDGPRGEIVDPYVSISIQGEPEDRQTVKTRTIQNNGFNPVWNETFRFEILCPEMAFIHISVCDADVGVDDLLCYRVVRATSIREGIRHVCLKDVNGRALRHAGLLARFSITKK